MDGGNSSNNTIKLKQFVQDTSRKLGCEVEISKTIKKHNFKIKYGLDKNDTIRAIGEFDIDFININNNRIYQISELINLDTEIVKVNKFNDSYPSDICDLVIEIHEKLESAEYFIVEEMLKSIDSQKKLISDFIDKIQSAVNELVTGYELKEEPLPNIQEMEVFLSRLKEKYIYEFSIRFNYDEPDYKTKDWIQHKFVHRFHWGNISELFLTESYDARFTSENLDDFLLREIDLSDEPHMIFCSEKIFKLHEDLVVLLLWERFLEAIEQFMNDIGIGKNEPEYEYAEKYGVKPEAIKILTGDSKTTINQMKTAKLLSRHIDKMKMQEQSISSKSFVAKNFKMHNKEKGFIPKMDQIRKGYIGNIFVFNDEEYDCCLE